MFATPLRLAPVGGTFVRVIPSWSTSNTETITATGGVSDGNNIESWEAIFGSGDLSQSTSGNRPQIETGDIAGLVMSKHSDTEHLTYTPIGTVRHFVATVYDYGAGSPRRLFAIDTDAATDKPAIEFLIEEVSS